MKAIVVCAFALVALVGTPGRAVAQFSTLDRQSTSPTEVGADFDYLFVNHDPGQHPGTSGFRFDLFGQFVDPHSGFGAYLSLALTHTSFAVDMPPFVIRGSGTGIGDLELGGIYVIPSRRADTSFVLHAGLTLPTSPSQTDNAAASQLGGFAHITDIAQTLPHGTSLRLGFSPIWHRGTLVARLDIGLDLDATIADGRTTLPPALRLNGGLGYASSVFALMGELTNVFITGNQNDGGNTTLNEAAVSARFFLGQGMSLAVAIVLPLEDDTKQLDAALRFGFTAQLR